MPFVAIASAVMAALIGDAFHSATAGFIALVALFTLYTLVWVRGRKWAKDRAWDRSLAAEQAWREAHPREAYADGETPYPPYSDI
jgi:hypothetical protein